MQTRYRLPRHWGHYTRRAVQARQQLADFYRASDMDASSPLAEVPLMALDLETTGLDAKQHAIVSVGLIPFSLSRIRCAEAQYWLVRPDTELASEALGIHGLRHTDLADAPSITSVLAELVARLQGHVAVVHYRPIEREFLWQAAQAIWQEEWLFPVIDTMEIERSHARPTTRSWWQREAAVSLRLADARSRYGLPAYAQHHALTDALATAELLQAQSRYHIAPSTPIGALWQ